MYRKPGLEDVRRTTARLMLALLLVLAPVVTAAGGMPLSAAPADQNMSTQPDHQMPCHSAAGQTAQAAAHTTCSRCDGTDQSSQCQCCDYAAPAGLISLNLNPPPAPVESIRSRPHVSDPLPDSPADRLYRPPIIQS